MGLEPTSILGCWTLSSISLRLSNFTWHGTTGTSRENPAYRESPIVHYWRTPSSLGHRKEINLFKVQTSRRIARVKNRETDSWNYFSLMQHDIPALSRSKDYLYIYIYNVKKKKASERDTYHLRISIHREMRGSGACVRTIARINGELVRVTRNIAWNNFLRLLRFHCSPRRNVREAFALPSRINGMSHASIARDPVWNRACTASKREISGVDLNATPCEFGNRGGRT